MITSISGKLNAIGIPFTFLLVFPIGEILTLILIFAKVKAFLAQ